MPSRREFKLLELNVDRGLFETLLKLDPVRRLGAYNFKLKMNLINSKQKVWLLVKCCVMVITVLVLLFLKHNLWVIDSHFSKFNPNLKNYLKTNDSFELRDNTNSLVDSTSNNSIEIGGIRASDTPTRAASLHTSKCCLRTLVKRVHNIHPLVSHSLALIS